MVFRGINTVGLRRSGVSEQERRHLHRAFKAIYRSETNTTDAIATVREQGELPEKVKHFVDFIERIGQGAHGRQNNP